MSTKAMYLCGVPELDCVGGKYTTDQMLPTKSGKGHSSSTDAFKCMARYLLKQGYVQVGSREFEPPDGGPIRILTKKSHYGCRLRLGKGGGKGGNRFMPPCKKGECKRGIIISC